MHDTNGKICKAICGYFLGCIGRDTNFKCQIFVLRNWCQFFVNIFHNFVCADDLRMHYTNGKEHSKQVC